MSRKRTPRRNVPAGGSVVSPRPPAYVARWNRVLDWSRDNTLGDLVYLSPPASRVAGWRGTWVYDIQDEEEAAERGILLSELPAVTRGPDREAGGIRRVSIRLYTWVIDDLGAFEPRWVTTGWGMSARAASDRHRRWMRDYQDAVEHGVESRKLVATAMEIVFWTAGESANYV